MLDLVRGREEHPRFGSCDLKFLIWRLGMLAWFGINLLLLAVSYERHMSIDYTLLTAVCMQNLYVADALFFEVRT